MNEGPAPVEGYGKERGILVLGCLEDAAALPLNEIAGLGQTHEWPIGRVTDVDDEVLVADASDPRVFDPPALLQEIRIGFQPLDRVDFPPGEPVVAGGDGQRGEAGAVLDPQ